MHEVPFFKVRESSREDEVKVLQAGSLLGLETLEGVSSIIYCRGNDEVQLCNCSCATVLIKKYSNNLSNALIIVINIPL